MQYTKVDGVDGSALGCDCYGGCWGDHSSTWPALAFASGSDAAEAWRLVHREMGGEPRAKPIVGYGEYVLMGRHLRFATTAARDAHAAMLDVESPTIEPPTYPRAWSLDSDGTWVCLVRGMPVFYVVSDNPKGYGTVRAQSPTASLEIALGHSDVWGSREQAEVEVRALVDSYLDRVIAARLAG